MAQDMPGPSAGPSPGETSVAGPTRSGQPR